MLYSIRYNYFVFQSILFMHSVFKEINVIKPFLLLFCSLSSSQPSSVLKDSRTEAYRLVSQGHIEMTWLGSLGGLSSAFSVYRLQKSHAYHRPHAVS